MAGDEQQFCLRWNNFPNNFASQFDALRHDEAFVDVTLTCEGRRIEAHKLVLSACSPYFKQLFKGNPCKHPIMFLHNVEFRHLKSLVEFMYVGEVNVAQTHLPAFLRTAESLQIRGLADNHAKFSDGRPLSSVNMNSSKRRDDNGLPNNHHITDSNNPDDSDDFSNSIITSKRPKHSRSSIDGLSHNMQGKLDRRDFPSDLLDTSTSMNPFIGLETTVEAVNNSGLTLQGALDAATAAAPSSTPNDGSVHHNNNSHSESSTSEGEVVKPHSLDPRPCPECGRVYSNISNLRQHIRLIHYPECIACPLCFKPFKNKLYLKRHLISYHELLPPSYMEKRYNYNTQTGGPVFTYKSQPPDGFMQRHNSNNGNSNNTNNSNNNSNNNNANTNNNGNEHHHPHHLHHHSHLHPHHPPTNNNRDTIMNHINFPHTNHIMPVQAVLSSPPQNFYPPNGDFGNIPNENTQQQQPPGPNDHPQVHMPQDPSVKQQNYSPQPQPPSGGPPTMDETTSGSDMNANNANK